MLRVLLRKYPKAKEYRNNDSQNVRTIFAHVGALKTLHNLAIYSHATRRLEIMFVAFGNHPNVDRTMWGMKEVYPIGKFYQ